VSDIDLSYKKSQMQVSVYQKPAENVDEAFCVAFHKSLNENPEKILEQLKGGENSPLNKGMKAFTEAQKADMERVAKQQKEASGRKDDL